MRIRVGTRGSKLALAQCDSVISILQKANPEYSFEKVIIHTKGDLSVKPLSAIGGNGLFVREIEKQLLDGTIDMAVHSMKDLPSQLSEGLMLCEPLKREERSDVLITADGKSFSDLKKGAVIATGSARRKAQLLKLRPDLQVVDIRGNIDTRIRKMKENGYDGIILAKAGLNRLNIQDCGMYEFSIDQMIPSPCQGVLAVEIREDRKDLYALMHEVHDETTALQVQMERGFLKGMHADCKSPIAASASIDHGVMTLHAMYGKEEPVSVIVQGNDIESVVQKAAQKIRFELSGVVSIVGAGPGDPEDITLKGLQSVRQADCILYDRLIPSSLLKQAKKGCKMIYVGKADHMHTMKQSQINILLVDKAMEYKRVVRLKGGDVSVFARTQEEIEYLKEKGIRYEVISGLSSCIAGPMAAGIPLTTRGISSAFHVLSAHGSNDQIQKLPYAYMAHSHDTWVILMGLRHVKEIAHNMLVCGMDGQTPIAVISNATTPMQKVHVSTIEKIVDEPLDLPSPAIIVVGETVRFCSQQAQDNILRKEIYLPKIGFEPSRLVELIPDVIVHEIQVSRIEYVDYEEDVIPDVALFTSRNGVDGFFRGMKKDIRMFGNTVFAAVGSSTAKRLKDYGITADYIPATYDSASLFESLSLTKQSVVCHYTGSLPSAHNRMYHGFDYRPVRVYDNVECEIITMDVREDAVIVFTCSSNVERMKHRMIHFEQWAKTGTAVVIGPSTYRTCQQLGIEHIIQAKQATYESLAEILK